MKKLLILGASDLQVPAIKKAKEMGCYVGVVDYNPKAPGIALADEFFPYSTIAENDVLKAARQFEPDGVMTLATDSPMRSVAKVCDEMMLKGISYETAVKATDKGAMLEAFEAKDVSHPWYYILSSSEDIRKLPSSMDMPCIIKPVDSSGSRGVILCRRAEDIIDGYRYAVSQSRKKQVVVEEFLQGPEFSVEALVIQGRPEIVQITDKITTGPPNFVEMGHSQPSEQAKAIQEKICDLTCQAIEAIGIDTGPVHAEMILTSAGPKMVEIGARLGGDYITTHLVPLSTGIDMVEATIDIALGNKVAIDKKIDAASAIIYFDIPLGTIKSIDNIEEAKKIPGVKEIKISKSIGDKIDKVKSSGDRPGCVIAQADTPENARKICRRAVDRIKISVD